MRAVELWDGCLRRACQGNEFLRRLSKKDQWINGSLSWLELQGSPWLTSDLSVSNQNHCFQWSVTWTIGPCSNLQPHLKEKHQVHLPCVNDVSLAWFSHRTMQRQHGEDMVPRRRLLGTDLSQWCGVRWIHFLELPSLHCLIDWINLMEGHNPHRFHDLDGSKTIGIPGEFPVRMKSDCPWKESDDAVFCLSNPNSWIPLFFAIFLFHPHRPICQCQWKNTIKIAFQTPVIKPYGPPHGGDVHDVSLLQFATHVLCLVDSRQPVGMPRRNGQQVTYQSWEETMEWVSICQRSSMSIKIAVPSKRTACDTANIYIYILYIYIIFKMLKLKCYKVCHNALGSPNPAHLVTKQCLSAELVGEWPTSRILESKFCPTVGPYLKRMCVPLSWVLVLQHGQVFWDQLLLYKCTPPCGRLSTKGMLQLRYKEINVRLIPTMLFGLRKSLTLCVSQVAELLPASLVGQIVVLLAQSQERWSSHRCGCASQTSR